MTDLDLDVGEPAPVRRRHPFGAAIALATLLGLTTGGVVASVTRPAPAVAASSALTASSRLQGVLLDPDPVAVVDVTVTGTGREPVTVVSVTAVGPDGARSDAGVFERVLEPGRVDTLTVRVPLTCRDRGTGQKPPVVTVGVRGPGLVQGPAPEGTAPEGTGGADPQGRVVADPTGRLSRIGGLCTAADAALPPGWRDRLPGRIVARSASSLTIEVSGEPPGPLIPFMQGKLSLEPDRAQTTAGPPLRVTLFPPVVRDCSQVAGSLPTTLPMLAVPEGRPPVEVLIQVGPELAGWLLEPFRTACPIGPNDSSVPISPAVTAP